MEYTYIFARVFFSELVLAAPILSFFLLLIVFIGHIIGRVEGWSKLDAIYHAFINATTVGYGDIEPLGDVRFLAGLEALLGLVLITWTASFLFIEMQKFWMKGSYGK